MSEFLGWLDHRTGYRGLLKSVLYERIPGGARWRYIWGSTLVFAMVVQLITGVVLWSAYSANAQGAWESVWFIQNQMAGGWLLRGIHHYMAQVTIVLLVLAPDAGPDRRSVSGAARGQLLVRAHPAAARARPLAHRIPAALGPEGFLGYQGRDEYRVHDAGRRSSRSSSCSWAARSTATSR